MSGSRSHSWLMMIMPSLEPRSPEPVLALTPRGWHPGGSCLRMREAGSHTKCLGQESVSPNVGNNSSSLWVEVWGGVPSGLCWTTLWVALKLILTVSEGQLGLCLSHGQAGLSASAQTWGVWGLLQWRLFLQVHCVCPVCNHILYIVSNNTIIVTVYLALTVC